MPRRRKKSSRSSRKPPLVFSESPLDRSLRFSSPTVGAVNPVTAEVITLQDDFATTWVSPQFDPTAPPSPRRRRGRRRVTETGRGACSQTLKGGRNALAVIDIIPDENRVCDRRKLECTHSNESLTDMENTSIVGSNKENCNIIDSRCDGQGTCMGYISDESADQSGMNLCSLVERCTLLDNKSQMGSRTPNVRCAGRRNNGEDKRGGVCPSCAGACISLADDTPVEEYSLRVTRRKRRGRLPKVAWDKLMTGV